MATYSLTSRDWPAPAKLNLFLHVTGRRADGYHLLQTLFQFVDFSDQLDFSINQTGSLTLDANYTGIDPDNDLIMRAARALQSASNPEFGADIRIDKRLPLGGGIGGGSSNAATTLVALNHLWNCRLTTGQLAEIGLSLGADVPVFVHGHAAWAEGVGEILTPVDVPEPWYVIIVPACRVATADIFNATDLTRNTPAITIRDFLATGGRNDCEPVVRRSYPEITAALDWLAEYGQAKLTGTGACVYAGFEDKEQARQICAAVPAQWQAIMTRGLNRSPLLDRLEREPR